MSLTQQEIESIAALSGDATYNLLLDKVQSVVDDMTLTLAQEKDPAKIASIFPLWQATWAVLHELRYTPQSFAQITEKKEDFASFNNPSVEKLRNYVRNLQQKSDIEDKNDYGWRSLNKKENKWKENIL